ncbi:hypothetical protein PR001_g16486 [Phytophthora rubi]|uniref:RNA-directed DNA polymerase n=4 Tax=Phytophthora TaxID=4783 RepID=A0A6A3L091_9STRA|nr:hypothetical protein PR001_g16486 [Phytophthora rubi]
MKTRCTILVENLLPQTLRTRVERMVDLEHRACRTDDGMLFDLVNHHAKLQDAFHRETRDARESVRNGRSADQGNNAGPGSAKLTQKAKSTPPSTGGSPAGSAPRDARKPSGASPRDGCLHCKGQHWVRECPGLSEEDRAAYVKNLRKREQSNAKAVRHAPNLESVPANHVRLNEAVEVPYIVDSGADKSMVPQRVVEELISVSPGLAMRPLDAPVAATLADGTDVTCTQSVTLDLQLVTAAGIVNVRGACCLVLPGTFLLGDETLRALGIDVTRQIEQLATPTIADDGADDEFAEPEYGPTEDDVIDEGVRHLLDEARENGVGEEHLAEMRVLLELYRDLWRVNVGPDPAARVDPLQVTLVEGAKPYRAKARKYAPLQSTFLRECTEELERHDFIRRNDQARWASPVVPVKKPGGGFRITTDYRVINSMTVPIAGTMPNLASAAGAVRGAVAFARFDLLKGFWQLPLHPNCQEMFSFLTEDAVYTPTRVPQGATDSALHFQAQLQRILAPLLHRNCLLWIDDILLFASSMDEFLRVFREFFELIKDHGLKLSVTKCVLFQPQVLWCGKMVSGTDIQHDPERLSALANLPPPPTVAALQQFLCAVNWVRDSLIDYARIAAPLYECLEQQMRVIGKRNKNGLHAALEWSPELDACFREVKLLLLRAAPLAHPAEDAAVCLLTDASADGWSVIVSQVVKWDADLPVHQQQHQLLVCKGGMFKGSQRNWSIVEKEAFPIVKACSDLEYLLLRPGGFRIYCDHANLIYIFDPSTELKRHVRDKLQRWAMRISGLPYTIEHIAGIDNVWADLVSRWGQQPAPEATQVSARADEVLRQQTQFKNSLKTSEFTLHDGCILIEGRMWIPSQATELIKRLMVIAHCGSQGHRGEQPMTTLLRDRFHVEYLGRRVEEFIRKRLLCKHVKGGMLVQRPWGPTYEAKERNEGVHWDFLTMGDSFGENRSILVIKDALTHYCELFPTPHCDSGTAAAGLLDWYKRYGKPQVLISDQGVHFRNETIASLCSRLKIPQDFTPVYSPWVNGTVERVNRDILQVIRALLMELRLSDKEWPYLLPIVQANLNHTPVASLAGRAPIELFLGLPPPSALDTIIVPRGTGTVEFTLKDGVDSFMEALGASLRAMHRAVIDVKEAKRLQAMASKRGVVCNFEVGDYVLWSRIDARLPTRKLLGRWVGPFIVAEAKRNSFIIRNLITGKQHEVHVTRLKFYHDSSLNITQEVREFVTEQGILLDVEAFKQHRFEPTSKMWQLRVSWVGLQDVEDSWESLPDLVKDVPARVADSALELKTIVELAKVPGIAALKDATDSVAHAVDVMALCDLPVVCAADNLALPMMACGAVGVMSILSNAAPARVLAITKAVEKGDFAAARKAHEANVLLVNSLFVEPNPMPIKKAMELLGHFPSTVRSPLTECSAETVELLTQQLKANKLL